MDEAENAAVEPEMAQEVAAPQSESDQDGTSQVSLENDRQDRNWRELRRQKDEADRKVRLQEELLTRLMSQQQQPQSIAEPEEDILSDIAKEEYVPGEKVAKGLKRLEQNFDRKLQEIEQRYKQKEQNSMFDSLRREFSDFDDIVNSENLALLEETNPRLANTIAASKDPYAIAIQSYEYIKAKGLSSKAPVSKRAAETERKLEQNKKSVQSPHVFDKRPMAQAFELTDAMKKDLRKEMYGAANQVGMGY